MFKVLINQPLLGTVALSNQHWPHLYGSMHNVDATFPFFVIIVDGNWGAWSEISACNKSCGYGYRHRYRYCDNPPPLFRGAPCPGTGVDVIPECNTHVCPGKIDFLPYIVVVAADFQILMRCVFL